MLTEFLVYLFNDSFYVCLEFIQYRNLFNNLLLNLEFLFTSCHLCFLLETTLVW